ncbi:MAG TPA: alpha/beta fold hydrolase [Terracidiphilus sp.]|nr:alpha/beta fold hydrolase [Terracidiphilus sp.]
MTRCGRGSFLLFVTAILLSCISAGAQDTSTAAGRKAYLQKMQQLFPDAPSFDKWLAQTGALPPDFTRLPKHNQLPDPLTFVDGRSVKTPADWAARRKEIDRLSQKYVWGTVPPRPEVDHVVVLDEKHEKGYIVRDVRLIFGPEDKGTMRARVVIPDGQGPFPVLVNSSLTGWAPELIRRGYMSAGFAGNDFMDDADALAALYPKYDFALLPRRAWAASLVVDYLETLPQVDKKHIAIYGYSRDGKMATIAAALDTRFAAVIAGSTGVGGVLPWRTSGEVGIGEGIEATTRRFPTWFAPQLRFFTGREDRLPVDGNLVAAMIAPRSLLMEWGTNDQVSNTWGNEQTYYSALQVYKLLGVPDRISTMRVPGFHGANDEQKCLDWLDIQFGRSHEKWTNNLIFQWDWDQWRRETGQSIDIARYAKHNGDDDLSSIHSLDQWNKKSAELLTAVESMLGSEPPKMTEEEITSGRFHFPVLQMGVPYPGRVKPDIPAWVMQAASHGDNEYGWPKELSSKTETHRYEFGDNLAGDLYYPAGTPENAKLPTVIWLHGYSYPLGYMWVYHEDVHPILALVHAGYAVFAYDQNGFGSRLKETGPFYKRYPQWSHMGRLVEDVQSAIDMLQTQKRVDPSKIYLYGYSLGGMVAIYTAALDHRVQGIVSVAGFTPMRTDTAATGTGGIARYSKIRDLIPRLGFFAGHESQLPYDFNDLLAMIAPRPVLIVQPQLDREAIPQDVSNAVEDAGKIYSLYSAQSKLALKEPWDINRLPNYLLDETVQWMSANEK